MDLRCKSKFTREQKIAIVEEFEKGALKCLHYGFKM